MIGNPEHMRDKTGKIDVSRLNELIPILIGDEGIVLAFLFGSYAQGKATSLSDVDIALLLSSEMPRDKYLHYQLRYSNLVSKILRDNRVDVVILNTASPLLAHEAIKGRILFERSPEARVNYVVDVQRRFLDLKSFYAIDFAYMHRRLEEGTFGKP
jgi:hypothetical protein